MKITRFGDDRATKAWEKNEELAFLNSELYFYTEGGVYFSDSKNDITVSVFLLEFYIEMEKFLLKRIGQKSFEDELILQNSGEYFTITKFDHFLSIQYKNKEPAVQYDYDCFVRNDLTKFRQKLIKKLIGTYPRLASLTEWNILFRTGE